MQEWPGEDDRVPALPTGEFDLSYPHLAIRADASPATGTGHLMRCLAVAEEWTDRGGTVTLITASTVEALLKRFESCGVRVLRLRNAYPADEDMATMRRLLKRYPEAPVLVDGYHFDGTYQSQILSAGYRLAVVDDNAHLPRYSADLILNQNIHAPELASRYPASARLLLGPCYALVRREFRLHRLASREHPDVARRILVSLGGGDPGDVAEKVLRALSATSIPGLKAALVVGAANFNKEAVTAVARQAPFPVQVQQDPRHIAEWMAWADLAVAAAGSTTWELAYMGLPSVLITVAENQRSSARRAGAMGIGLWAGDGHELTVTQLADAITAVAYDRAQREAMSRRGRQLVDGQGAVRFVDALFDLRKGTRLTDAR